MPQCQGLSTGPCPKLRNDASVRLGEGDLMLCPDCDKTRFQEFLDSRNNDKNGSSAAQTTVSEKMVIENTATTIVSDTTPTSSRSSVGDKIEMKVNELLSYVKFYRDRASVENLRKLIVGFYSAREINSAKKLLVASFSAFLTNCSLKAERRKSATREVYEAETDDIIGIFEFLDHNCPAALKSVCFVAIDFDRVPKYGPEELNICAIADKQCETQAQIVALTNRMDCLSQTQADQHVIAQRIDGQIAQLSDLCEKLGESVKCQSNTVPQAAAHYSAPITGTSSRMFYNSAGTTASSVHGTSDTVDRSRNVVIFGVDDDTNMNSWRDMVLKALQTAAGKDVTIDDAFRLGSPAPGKKRPILVKLRSCWDRRLIVSGAWRLSSADGLERIFISPDEPITTRRKRTLERLVKKASNDGKHVVVDNGVVTIDSVMVFSLENGFLQKNDG